MSNILPVIGWPSAALRQPAKAAASFDERHRALATELSEILRVSNGKGIAAPQVGLSLRLIVIEVPGRRAKGRARYAAFVNPRILDKSAVEAVACEDCLSLHTISHLFVMRPQWVTVEHYNLDGERKVDRYEGGVAAMFCHLIDHLDGKCLPDAVDDLTHARIRQLREPYAGARIVFAPPPPLVITNEDLTPEEEAAEEEQLVNDIADAAAPLA